MNETQVVHQASAYPGFSSMKRLGVFLPLDEILVYCRASPCIKFSGTYSYTWVEWRDGLWK